MRSLLSSNLANHSDYRSDWGRATPVIASLVVPVVVGGQILMSSERDCGDPPCIDRSTDQPALIETQSGTTHPNGMGL